MSVFATALIWMTVGSMLLFGAVVAPIVFGTLDETNAGKFLRALFPRFYLFCGGLTCASAGLSLAGQDWVIGGVLVVTGALFFWSRGPLTREINVSRDAQLAGDEAAGERFDRLHKLSTRLFGVQALVLLGIALRASIIG